jgi:hypothetical protein
LELETKRKMLQNGKARKGKTFTEIMRTVQSSEFKARLTGRAGSELKKQRGPRNLKPGTKKR